ncbi:MAG: hypothetical protein PHX26_11825, partial [Proteiniphilum sp.]|nr:hypothetical protein [Proteiniphilum sp.]
VCVRWDMKRERLETYLGKQVEIIIFDGTVYKGEFHKTGELQFKNNPNLWCVRQVKMLAKGPQKG